VSLQQLRARWPLTGRAPLLPARSVKLFPDECPRSVENFTTHAKNAYYDNVIFHRVIKGFMIQTGDPQGEQHHALVLLWLLVQMSMVR
jgi:hypothetical protein